jgi:hypothetical protein
MLPRGERARELAFATDPIELVLWPVPIQGYDNSPALCLAEKTGLLKAGMFAIRLILPPSCCLIDRRMS